jgi:hypothetical protein
VFILALVMALMTTLTRRDCDGVSEARCGLSRSIKATERDCTTVTLVEPATAA